MKTRNSKDELDKMVTGKSSSDTISKEVEDLNMDVPKEVMDRIKNRLDMTDSQKKVTVGGLSKELMEIAPEYKNRMRFSVVLACFGELFSFATYFFSAYAASWLIQRQGANPPGIDILIKYGSLAIISLTIYLMLTGVSTVISHKTSFTILEKLRGRLFDKLKEIPQGYLVDNPVGKIKVIIQDRVADMEDWVAHIIPELPSRLLHPLLCIVILFCLDWRLGLSIFAPIPLVYIGMASMMYQYKARMNIWMSSYGDVAERSAEYVRGIPVIKAFLQDKKSYGKFADSVNFYHSSTMEWWRRSWFGNALMMAAIMTPQLVTLPLAFYLYSIGQISVSTLLLALVLPISILPQAFALVQSFELFNMVSVTWISIRELLDMPKQVRPSCEKIATLDENKGIEFDNVSFSYKEGQEVLHNISFTANKNEITALVGPSGGGKSTVAKLVAGLWDQSKGNIFIGGVDTKNIPFNQLAEEVSYVSQDNFLFDVSIRDNIRLGKPNATEEEIIQASKAAMCHDFITQLPNGYDTSAGEAGGAMSGGERQRITLARAILKPSKTIILDEATAYADPENEALIQDAISSLIEGKNVLVVAHRLHTIVQADKIIVLNKGNIVSQGRHKQLMEKCSLYKNLWQKYAGEEC